MKFTIYYGAVIIANILSAFLLHEHLNITLWSAIPVALMLVMIFQVSYFKHDTDDKGFSTAYGSGYTHEEEKGVTSYISNALLFVLPLLVPFILFFTSYAKLISILVYAIALLVGSLIYRITHKDDLNARVNQEKKDLEEQKKKEELGEWK